MIISICRLMVKATVDAEETGAHKCFRASCGNTLLEQTLLHDQAFQCGPCSAYSASSVATSAILT